MVTRKKSGFMDNFCIESPEGKKAVIFPPTAWAPDFRNDGILAHRRVHERWYGQFVDVAEKLNLCKEFVDAKFNPASFLKLIKAKGYKVYWQ